MILPTANGKGWLELLDSIGKPSEQEITQALEPLGDRTAWAVNDLFGESFEIVSDNIGETITDAVSESDIVENIVDAVSEADVLDQSFDLIYDGIGEMSEGIIDNAVPEIDAIGDGISIISDGASEAAEGMADAASEAGGFGKAIGGVVSGLLTAAAVTLASTLAIKGLEAIYNNLPSVKRQRTIDRGKEAQSRVEDIQKAYTEKETNANDIVEEYGKLREGIGEHNKNVSLSNADYERFIELNG